MPLRRYKNSRAININTNIIISSVVATLIATYPVYLTKMFTDSMILIALISFFIDAILDFIFFIGLHVSVHKHHFKKFRPSKIILRDILGIQTQRVFLALIYFVVSVGLHYWLMMMGLGRVSSFLLAYFIALGVTRSIHTIYGIKTGLFKSI